MFLDVAKYMIFRIHTSTENYSYTENLFGVPHLNNLSVSLQYRIKTRHYV